MIGVTIGMGVGYKVLAHRAMESVKKYTGLECICIEDAVVEHRHRIPFVKLDIFDYVDDDDIFYFDADTRTLLPWDVQPSDKLVGVLDHLYKPMKDEIDRNAPHVAAYINTGIMILNRQLHQSAFKRAKELARDYPIDTNCYEQTYLNLAIHECGVEQELLPERYNYTAYGMYHDRMDPPADVVVAHAACGMSYVYKGYFDDCIRRCQLQHS